MNFYQAAGLILAVIAGACLMELLLGVLPKVWRERRMSGDGTEYAHAPEFLSEIPQAYQAGGSIRGMLERLEAGWENQPEGKKAREALEYLEQSRYKDYETALFGRLSDHTPECELWLREILELELCRKRFQKTPEGVTEEGEKRR